MRLTKSAKLGNFLAIRSSSLISWTNHKDLGLYSLILPLMVTAIELTEGGSTDQRSGNAMMEFAEEHIYQRKVLSEYVERRTEIMKTKVVFA